MIVKTYEQFCNESLNEENIFKKVINKADNALFGKSNKRMKDLHDEIDKKDLSDEDKKNFHKSANIGQGIGKGIIVAGIGAIGFGLYKAIKGIINALKSDKSKLENLQKQLSEETDDNKKEQLKEKIKQLKESIKEKEDKIKQKKEEAKKEKNESLELIIDDILTENLIFV